MSKLALAKFDSFCVNFAFYLYLMFKKDLETEESFKI